ncbi:hypothetical protein GQR58_030387 [Nymphon striatum]|nr:hypothetical protein GQR58_030387 [Nymphon striatum]
MFHGFPAAVDVFEIRPRKPTNLGVFGQFGDFGDGVEVALGGDGEAGFDDIDAHFIQHLCDFQLFVVGHCCAGGLLAIAQGRVKDQNLIGHFGISLISLVVSWRVQPSERSRRRARSEATKEEAEEGLKTKAALGAAAAKAHFVPQSRRSLVRRFLNHNTIRRGIAGPLCNQSTVLPFAVSDLAGGGVDSAICIGGSAKSAALTVCPKANIGVAVCVGHGALAVVFGVEELRLHRPSPLA